MNNHNQQQHQNMWEIFAPAGGAAADSLASVRGSCSKGVLGIVVACCNNVWRYGKHIVLQGA
jgi:hypothetical protein